MFCKPEIMKIDELHNGLPTKFSVYDLLSEDHDIYIRRNTNNPKEIDIRIDDKKGNAVYQERSHIFAWQSLVNFAEQVIELNKSINHQEKWLMNTHDKE